ncbi:hypothetical protein Vretimale_3730 [Volvox reticuliferus]|uniref:Uncharacterized protein n=1 Tax=Volvox reticuliferus TaxID=1737510 RepID=A0A8J4G3U2_9CHLO|nr:hypothetical protein Vretifemale_1329 [Volvox reticuliferus]GIL98341.1 hypothetical protein Vretimale_3730 [Volvox reticuliferus]
MILRLRHAVPWLQKVGGWSAYTPPVLSRRFSGTFWTLATLVPNAAETEPDSGHILAYSVAADLEKKKRRSSRGAKVGDLAGADQVLASISAAAVAADSSNSVVEAGRAAGSSSEEIPSKKRTSSRRKTAASTGDAAEQPSASGATGPDAVQTPKRTRRKRLEGREEENLQLAAKTNPPAEDDTEARHSSGADASSSGDTTTSTVPQKRSNRTTSKKAGVTSKASSDDAGEDERISIQNLPYESCLVLPRKAEQILVALGLRAPHDADSAVEAHEDNKTAAGPLAPASGRGGSIGSVLELASYLGRPDPKEMVTPLLIAQYQGYLGPSPDYLYDLFYLDYDPPFLSSDVVRTAAVAAARGVSRAASLLSAKGTPSEALARAAIECLVDGVGEAAVAAQETRAPRLTEAQLELFLMDWASARLTGLKGEGGIPYLARRCAALQVTRPIVVERLYRYAVRGQSLQELANTGGRTVRLSQPMDALIEGLKAGVRMDSERLLHDFRLISPGAPLGEHLEEVRRMIVSEAHRSFEPGSAMYYSTLVEKLHVHPDIKVALRQQEAQWQKEQGERDGSALTQAQVRLLFHLWRLERFRAEEQARQNRTAGWPAANGPS